MVVVEEGGVDPIIVAAGIVVGIVLFFLVINVASYFVTNPFISPGVGDEYQEYLEIRDYSNCTKANDSVCLGGCVHTYRKCQIDHCGSAGIGW